MKGGFFGILVIGTLLCFWCETAITAPIYVYREGDGTIRFSSFPPEGGKEAKVFTAKSAKFSYYSSRCFGGGRSIQTGRLFRERFRSAIKRAARQHKVDEDLIRAVIHVESGFNTTAVSPKGAMGLMQLLPENVRLLGIRDPFDSHENISGGARWLAALLRRFYGDVRLALAAYNAGIAAVEKYRGIPPYEETRSYVAQVLAIREQYRKAGG